MWRNVWHTKGINKLYFNNGLIYLNRPETVYQSFYRVSINKCISINLFSYKYNQLINDQFIKIIELNREKLIKNGQLFYISLLRYKQSTLH